MRSRADLVFALGGLIVLIGAVVGGIFGIVVFLDKLHGPHVPSGWAYVTYTIDGDVDGDQQEAMAKSIVFRMHMGRAADARWWVHDDTMTVAVPESERPELESLPEESPVLGFGGVTSSGSVGEGPVKDAAQCRKPPDGYACDRERHLWYQLGEPALTGSDVASSSVRPDKAGTGAFAIEMHFSGEHKETLEKTTTTMAGESGDAQRLAVVYGGIVLSASPVAEPTTNGTVRLPGFSKGEGDDLASAIEAGKLDVTLTKGPIEIAD